MSAHPTINHQTLNAIRAELGQHFSRILSYFAEDGIKSIQAIEEAVQFRDAAAMVRPAHTLKGESLQFGAEALGYASEYIEHTARRAVEAQSFPGGIGEHTKQLRSLFEDALNALQHATTPRAAPPPPVAVPAMGLRRPAGGFGRKVG